MFEFLAMSTRRDRLLRATTMVHVNVPARPQSPTIASAHMRKSHLAFHSLAENCRENLRSCSTYRGVIKFSSRNSSVNLASFISMSTRYYSRAKAIRTRIEQIISRGEKTTRLPIVTHFLSSNICGADFSPAGGE